MVCQYLRDEHTHNSNMLLVCWHQFSILTLTLTGTHNAIRAWSVLNDECQVLVLVQDYEIHQVLRDGSDQVGQNPSTSHSHSAFLFVSVLTAFLLLSERYRGIQVQRLSCS
jgi:hypothetical protein